MTLFTTVESPIGTLLLASEAGELTALYMHGGEQAAAKMGWTRDDSSPVLRSAAEQLQEYFAGRRSEFDLPLRMDGTEFQRRVWSELLNIPFGQTISYGELARRVGNPAAARAVGLANGRNPISIVVPCHRVIGSSGRLVGYGGGLDRKKFLLDLERREAQAELFA